MAQLIYLKHKDIDFARWDACLAVASNRLIYAQSAYLNAICPTWEAIVSILPSGDYESILPIPARKKFGVSYISQPYFCQQLGVYSRLESVEEVWFEEAMQLILKRFRYCNRYFIDLRVVLNTSPPTPLLRGEGSIRRFSSPLLLAEENNQRLSSPLLRGEGPGVRFFTHLLSLNKPYSEIHKNFSSDRKQNLVRAKNAGWQIEQSTDFEGLVKLHQQHNELKAVGRNLNIELYRPYINLCNTLIKSQKAALYFATKNGRAEAGCLFVFSENRIIYLFNGASPIGRKQHGRLLILNKIFEEYANQDYVFDFEDPTDAPEVSSYYGSFNAQKEHYTSLTWMNLPKPIDWLLKLRRRFF